MGVKIGITGGIASGKSLVCSILSCMGIPIYNADLNAKRLMETDFLLIEKLTNRFGRAIYQDHRLNRKLLASLVFDHPLELKALNELVHPVLKQDFAVWCKNSNQPIVGIESAILFESGFDCLVDHTIAVCALLEIRILRALERDQVSKEEILKRIQNQLTEEQRNVKANFLIHNYPPHALIPQLTNLLKQLN